MFIEGMIKSSFVDYPGMVSCVLFTPGCNYNCFYCHNRDLIKGSGYVLDYADIFSFLKKRAGMLEGVVITGGEPTLQKGLIEFIKEIKALGYKVKLDTNGSNPCVVKKLLDEKLCDYYAVDYKAPFAMYPDVCGFPADNVLETINILSQQGVDFEVRTTVFPQLTLDDLLTMAKELPLVPKYVLNRYRKPEKFLEKDIERINATPYTQDELKVFAEKIRKIQPNISA